MSILFFIFFIDFCKNLTKIKTIPPAFVPFNDRFPRHCEPLKKAWQSPVAMCHCEGVYARGNLLSFSVHEIASIVRQESRFAMTVDIMSLRGRDNARGNLTPDGQFIISIKRFWNAKDFYRKGRAVSKVFALLPLQKSKTK